MMRVIQNGSFSFLEDSYYSYRRPTGPKVIRLMSA